ncbi:MAG TPA: PEP-CTERM sorting domain-containing protein [Tepidisphaeraceae bacterium]
MKTTRILSLACATAAMAVGATAFAQQQVFVDNFKNGSITDSDSVPGFWQQIPNDLSTVTEPVGGPETLTAQSTGTAGDDYPFAELSATSLESSFNFFQQPIILSVSNMNYSANSVANSLTEFNFGSQLTVQGGTIQTEYNEPSDFSLEICPTNGPNGQIIMGEKSNYPNHSSPWDSYQLIGPIGHVTAGAQSLGSQVTGFTLVLDSQFYDLTVQLASGGTKEYSGGLNLMNTGQYPWTTGAYAPGDPELNVETQIGGTTNGTDIAQLNIGQLAVSQMNMTYTGAAGDGNYFTAGNWSGLSSTISSTVANTLKITVPDYASSSATFPQANGPTTIALDNGNGNTITLGTLNINSSQPYTINGGIVQFATSGSTDRINITAGNQTLNAGVTIYEAHSAWNVSSGASLLVNGPVSTPYTDMSIDTSGGAGAVTVTGNFTSEGNLTLTSGAGPLNITGDFAAAAAITLNAGTGGMTITDTNVSPSSEGSAGNDFLFHGPLTLNVAAGGTLTIDSYLDDPFTNGVGTYPITKTGGGLAVVAAMYEIPSVTVSGGTLRIQSSPTANNFNYGGSLIDSLSISGGKLDLTNNDLVISYSGSSPLTTIRGYLQTGALYSSTASLALGTTVGYAEATEIGQTSNFYGLPTNSTSLCLMYTYDGDLNMDGVVNSADYQLMLHGNGSDWYNGDLNYDGKINADDWALFQLGLAASSRGDINNLPAPEPSSLGLIVAGGAFLQRRRRAN